MSLILKVFFKIGNHEEHPWSKRGWISVLDNSLPKAEVRYLLCLNRNFSLVFISIRAFEAIASSHNLKPNWQPRYSVVSRCLLQWPAKDILIFFNRFALKGLSLNLVFAFCFWWTNHRIVFSIFISWGQLILCECSHLFECIRVFWSKFYVQKHSPESVLFAWSLQLYLKRDSGTGAFLWILRNF